MYSGYYRVKMYGIQIDGMWYWHESFYGFRGNVRIGCPTLESVDIYNMDGEQRCTARRVQ